MNFLNVSVAVLFASALALSANAKEWETYESEQFDVQFKIPASWSVESDENTLLAAPEAGDVSFAIVAYQDTEIGTQELFEKFVNNIGLDAEGEYEEIEDYNGFHAYMGHGVAEIEGSPMLMIAVALTLDANNLIAYVFCNPEQAESKQDVMTEILRSISPLK